MTLLETERLVRKIREELRDEADMALAGKLAADFAGAVKSASIRLQQCETMIKAGDFPQAIQLAETAPNLLDLVTVLEFRELDAWRRRCADLQLPAVGGLDARAVSALNDCYAKGITADDPLYKQYRKAVLGRDDEAALRVLKSITRLNPGDANATGELTRLDTKVLNDKLAALQAALATGAPDPIGRQVEQIEAFGFQNRPTGSVWQQAQVVRCGLLLGGMEAMREANRWQDVLVELDFVRSLVADHRLTLPPEEERRFETLDTWVNAERERHRKEMEFAALQAELWHRVQQSEEKDTGARAVPLVELKEDNEALHRVWRAMEQYFKSVPDELAGRFRKRSQLLAAEITRRNRHRLQAIVGAVVAGLLILVGISWLVLAQMRARDFATQLADLRQKRQLRPTEKLLEQLHALEAGLLNRPVLKAALAQAESFVAQEQGKVKAWEEAFASLPVSFTEKTDAGQVLQIQQQFSKATNFFALMAPDVRADEQVKLARFFNQWDQFLQQHGQVLNESFETLLREFERGVGGLDYSIGPAKMRAALLTLAPVLAQLGDLKDVPAASVRVRKEFRERLATALAKFTAFRQQMEKYDTAISLLWRATALTEFATARAALAASEFTSDPVASAAAQARGGDMDGDTVLRTLLFTTNTAAWIFLKANPEPTFVPKVVMPAVEVRLFALKTQTAISPDLYRSRIFFDAAKTKQVDWITVGKFRKDSGWESIPTFSPEDGANEFSLAEKEYSYRGNRMALLPGRPQPVEVTDLGRCKEADSFYALRVPQVVAPDGKSFRTSLLQVLDELKSSKDGSVLFRAYLFSQLVQIMELQPEEWGLVFAPAIRMHQKQLETLGALRMKSGDWFIPAREKELVAPLEQAFAAMAQISYREQARTLALLAVRTQAAGMHYAGHVGMDGQLVLTTLSHRSELWGTAADNLAPALLFRAPKDSRPALQLRAGAVLSPVFSLGEERHEILFKAGLSAATPVLQGVWPPLFTASAQPK